MSNMYNQSDRLSDRYMTSANMRVLHMNDNNRQMHHQNVIHFELERLFLQFCDHAFLMDLYNTMKR